VCALVVSTFSRHLEYVADAGISARQAASQYRKALSSADVLQENIVGKENLFVRSKHLSLPASERRECALHSVTR